jgi:uncharacterized membrane protein HdeD (DUF308 family)
MAKSKSPNLSHYWGKQVHYAFLVHASIGAGVGLLVYPYLSSSGVANVFGWVLVLLGILGHLYALVA